MTASLQIAAATTSPHIRRFMDLPFALYKDNPCWVAPLRYSQSRVLRQRTAFFRRARMELFLAARGRETVGRLAAIHNTAHNEQHGDRVGFFGFFECRPDPEAARALFAAAEAWLADRGLTSARGPVSPSMNDTCGLLIAGFDELPAVMMPYNPPHYAGLLEACGFTKAKDMYAYRFAREGFSPDSAILQRLNAAADRFAARQPEIALRPIDMKHYRDEIIRFMDVFEEARDSNWGHVPLTRAEILETADGLRHVADPNLILVAEIGGTPIGVALVLPDINPTLFRIRGRLFPLGYLRLCMDARHTRAVRALGFATLKAYRRSGVTVRLMAALLKNGLQHGYRECEASWVLEDNVISLHTFAQLLDARPAKTYRIFEKPIGNGP